MRKGFIVALMVSMLFGAGYFYYIAQAVCPTPVTYSIGNIDSRFNLSEDDVRLVVSQAESVWEDATGRNLFTYEKEGDIVIHFVYDERQKFVSDEGSLKAQLDTTEHMSESVQHTYTDLIAEYNRLRDSYNTRANAYETKLRTYNAEVEKYNKAGGAPAGVYASLGVQKNALDAEQQSLNSLSGSLNALVKQINLIGEKGNLLVKTYNQGVGVYNKTFGEPREFTQGDYTDGIMKIYTFKDQNELKLVLAHELGHALSLDHVAGSKSVMYYLIGEQPKDIVLSDADMTEFNHVCGALSLWERIKLSLQRR